MMKKKQKIMWVAVLACILLFIVCLSAFYIGTFEGRKLRQKYPLISQSAYALDTSNLDFEKRVEVAINLAEIEIVEKLPNYTVLVEDKAENISKPMTFCPYKARVIHDFNSSALQLAEDDTIVLTMAEPFASSYPTLTKGMTAIVSFEPAKGEHTEKYILSDKTFYYVEKDKALAAYESDDSIAKSFCNEQKLIQQIEKIRNTGKS